MTREGRTAALTWSSLAVMVGGVAATEHDELFLLLHFVFVLGVTLGSWAWRAER